MDLSGDEEAATRIIDRTETGESTLTVCNTIASSAELTDIICENETVAHLGVAVREYLTSNNISAIDPEQSPKEIAYEVLCSPHIDLSLQLIKPGRGRHLNPPLFVLTFNSRYRPFDRRILIHLLTMLSTAPVRFVLCVDTGHRGRCRCKFQNGVPRYRTDRQYCSSGRTVQPARYEWGKTVVGSSCGP